MGALINDKEEKQPFVASCVDAGPAKGNCARVLDDLEGIHAYLKQGRQYLGSGSEVDAFEEEVKAAIEELDQITYRLNRRDGVRASTSDPVL